MDDDWKQEKSLLGNLPSSESIKRTPFQKIIRNDRFQPLVAISQLITALLFRDDCVATSS
jgi:hypothetical protein